jgi:sortase A
MFGDNLDHVSVEELEKALLVKKRKARLDRFSKMSKQGHSAQDAVLADVAVMPPPPPALNQKKAPPPVEKTRSRKVMDVMLLGLEVLALTGLVAVLVASYYNLRELNDEVSLAQQNAVKAQVAPTPTAVPPIALAILPGGHSPPTSPGGAVPDVPPHLQRWVQPSSSAAHSAASAIQVDQQNSKPPSRIVIPKINVDAPIVDGVAWEDLKQGVGHLPGSANPGERGNMYLAAHNDIYGEIFRYLEDLEVGDEYFVYAGDEKFRYVVKERRIIDPTDVEVMLPTTEPVATLQTCYPYMVDTHRLVVISELAE